MKIRSGFVSNSSSSSFVLIAEKQDIDTILKEGHEVIRHLIRNGEKVKAFGKELELFSGYESTEDGGYELDDYVGEIVNVNGKIIGRIDGPEDLEEFYDDYEAVLSYGGALRYIKNQLKKKDKDFVFNEESC